MVTRERTLCSTKVGNLSSLLEVGFSQLYRTGVLRILCYFRTHPLKSHAITCASIYATQESMLSRYIPGLKS